MPVTGIAKQYLKVFRFAITVGGRQFGVESCRWEGTSFIITRAIEKDPTAPPLHTLWLQAKPEVFVTLLTGEGTDAVVWRIDYDRAVNRGPDLLHAAKDDVAREAVCLVNARAVSPVVVDERIPGWKGPGV